MRQVSQQPSPAAPLANEPNLYELRGRNISVTFSTTSFSGKPLFHFRDRNHDLNRQGDEIRQIDTELGKLVTITIDLTVDSGSVSFSLLIPRVRLSDGDQGISTVGVYTRHRFSIAPITGQLQQYSAVKLSGHARSVAF